MIIEYNTTQEKSKLKKIFLFVLQHEIDFNNCNGFYKFIFLNLKRYEYNNEKSNLNDHYTFLIKVGNAYKGVYKIIQVLISLN